MPRWISRAIRSSSRSFFTQLLIGMTFGFSLSVFYIRTGFELEPKVANLSKNETQSPFLGDDRDARNDEDMVYVAGPDTIVETRPDTNYFRADEDIVAREMYKKVRVLCWVMTGLEKNNHRIIHAKRIWGKRCNTFLFISSKPDSFLEPVTLPPELSEKSLWVRTREAFRYIWQRYKEEADWFMKADEDTFVVVENLRYLLSAYNASEPLWFGHKLRSRVKQSYFTGAAGYVLSREALRRFVEKGIQDPTVCPTVDTGQSDIEMGRCMANLKVLAIDTRDSHGRDRFFPFRPKHHLVPSLNPKRDQYWQHLYYPPKEGMDGCSDTAISFHYLDPDEMYTLEYFLYYLRPFGISRSWRGSPLPPPDKDLQATPWGREKADITSNVPHIEENDKDESKMVK